MRIPGIYAGMGKDLVRAAIIPVPVHYRSFLDAFFTLQSSATTRTCSYCCCYKSTATNVTQLPFIPIVCVNVRALQKIASLS